MRTHFVAKCAPSLGELDRQSKGEFAHNTLREIGITRQEYS